jgi:hypothetical protein
MGHIAERFVIHFFSSCGVVLCVLLVLRMIQRRKPSKFLPSMIGQQLVFAALAVFAASTLREAWDVHQGQTVTKAVFDYISWLSGAGLSAWGLYRIGGQQ